MTGFQTLVPLMLLLAAAPSRAGETVSLLLLPGDQEALLYRVMAHTGVNQGDASPIIITLEPGPLELSGGLRLLASEMPPNLTLPDRLIVSAQPDAAYPDAFLAFMRRCLIHDIPVWLVGDQFPEDVAAFPMQPGWVIELIPPAKLQQRLEALCLSEQSAPR